MTDKGFNKTTDTYFYSEQLKKYMIQFLSIFSGLLVKHGKNDHNSENQFQPVQVKMGSSSRVVDAIKAGHTQNKPFVLPCIAGQLTGFNMAPELMKGVGQVDRNVVFPRGGSMPDDLYVVETMQPIPYYGKVEVNIFASNQDQHYQILEQILMLFNPTLQIQKSDDVNDSYFISSVELEDINFNENYPKAEDSRIITTTLQFKFTCYLQPPANIHKKYIKSIRLRLQAIRQTEDINETLSNPNRNVDYQKLFDIDDYDIPAN